ncbi:MAG: hypothetical protein COB15_13845 [Flavobacteriales bacterium]|nr:MAG: hypothetical protein COB15_13845 [Flavobacteriales bacterium]
MIKITIVLACALTLLGCQEQSNSNDAATINTVETETNQKSQLQVIKLSGTPFEIGFQHGQTLKKEIHDLVMLWEADIELNFKIPSKEFITKFLKSTDYISAIKKWTPHLYDEIRGISEGSEIELDKILVFQLVDEMWNNGGIIFEAHHCSSIGINNRKSDGDINYIAQNIDVTPFYHKYKVLLDIEDQKSNSHTFVVTVPGIIGVNGLNKAIGVNVNSLMDLKNSSDGLPVCCVVRGVLDQSTFNEAEEFLRKIKHASGQNYIIGSKHNVASYECSASKVEIYWPDSTKRYTYHANNALKNNSYQPSYINQIEDSFNLTHEEYIKDVPRTAALKNRILNTESINIEVLKETLKSKDSETDPICNDWTWASTIMEFHDDHNVLFISPGKPDSVDYEKFIIR